jgi:DNA polymerase-4
MTQRAIIHIDLDAFFVAVEQLDDPALIGQPVIVGGRPDARGVVASASYEARRFGVRSAMPTAQALRLCPEAIVLPGSRGRYSEMSRRVMAILRNYTPLVEQVSIDEAFLDVSGTEAQYGPPAQLAAAIQARIQSELGLSASLGVAANKLIAKIASDFQKPHGITVVPPGEEAGFLAPLPVRKLWGVGEVTSRELSRLDVQTVGDLARLPLETLRQAFGSHGVGLWRGAHGMDDSPVVTEHEIKSLSREETFTRDTRDAALMRRELLRLSDAVAASLRRHGLTARTVSIKLRYADFKTLTRQRTLAAPVDSGAALYEAALSLLETAWNRQQAVRLLGVGAAGLTEIAGQLPLFEAPDEDAAVADLAARESEAARERRARLDAALDRIRQRFGNEAIQRASLLEEPEELWVPRTGTSRDDGG